MKTVASSLYPCLVDSCTCQHPWQHAGGLGGQAELHPCSDIGSHRLSNGKGSNAEDRSEGVSRPLYKRSTQPHIALWLVRPIRRHTGDSTGPEASAPLSLSWEQATVHFWPATYTISDDNSLQCANTADATTTRHSIFYFAACRTRRHVTPPTTSTLPTLNACSPSWSRSGLWHAPSPLPTGNERERLHKQFTWTTRSITTHIF